jgi:hypothetical protein
VVEFHAEFSLEPLTLAQATNLYRMAGMDMPGDAALRYMPARPLSSAISLALMSMGVRHG